MASLPVDKLSGYEQTLLRFLAKNFDSGWNDIGVSQLPEWSSDRDKVEGTIARFRRYEIVEYSSSDSIEIFPVVMDYLNLLDNPPKKDYVKEVEAWAKSKPLIVVLLFLLVFGPGAIKAWIDILKAVMEWLGWWPSSR